jgi:hypothetical protein
MLAQFQSKYPQGSLTSELVEIFQGKYIVRASVQIEGVIRATGMAVSDNLEEAEDRARTRAIMVLGVTTSEETPAVTSVASVPTSQHTSSIPAEIIPVAPEKEVKVTHPVYQAPEISVIEETQETPPSLPIINYELPFDEPMEDVGMIADESEDNLIPGFSNNVTPFTPRSYEPEIAPPANANKRKKKTEPVDHSEAIAKIDVEMERLNWTRDQGREYLVSTYKKRARSLLTDEELLDFLRYLESQPTPVDPIAGF